MNTKHAGERAKGGFWFNTKTWELHLHKKDGEMLPGEGNERFLRIPTLALLIVGPIMGFAFVIFLPTIGFALALRELGRRVAGLFGHAAPAKDGAATRVR